jgi:hypothetical protein
LPRCWVGVDANGAPSPSSPREPWRGSVWCGRAETLASADEVDGFGRARARSARWTPPRGSAVSMADLALLAGSQRSFVPPPLMMLDKDLVLSSVVLVYSCPMTCELRCGILRPWKWSWRIGILAAHRFDRPLGSLLLTFRKKREKNASEIASVSRTSCWAIRPNWQVGAGNKMGQF